MPWLVYLLRCRDGTLYCGVTTDLARRIEAHNAGKGAKYTARRRPVRLVWTEPAADRSAALRREHAVKRLTRREKLALARERPTPGLPARPRAFDGCAAKTDAWT